jgi:hypothetical protein
MVRRLRSRLMEAVWKLASRDTRPVHHNSLKIDGSFAALILFLRNLNSMYSSNSRLSYSTIAFTLSSPLPSHASELLSQIALFEQTHACLPCSNDYRYLVIWSLPPCPTLVRLPFSRGTCTCTARPLSRSRSHSSLFQRTLLVGRNNRNSRSNVNTKKDHSLFCCRWGKTGGGARSAGVYVRAAMQGQVERGECQDAFCDGGSWGWCGEHVVMAWGWAVVLLEGTCSQIYGLGSSYVEAMDFGACTTTSWEGRRRSGA